MVMQIKLIVVVVDWSTLSISWSHFPAKTLKIEKQKKRTIVWNLKSYHPAKSELKRIKTAKEFPKWPHLASCLPTVIRLTTKRNKQHWSKSTNYSLLTWPFESAEESLCFLRGPLGGKKRKRDLKSYVISKRGNCSEETAGRWKNITARVKQIYLHSFISFLPLTTY